jgi:hypothetical protein
MVAIALPITGSTKRSLLDTAFEECGITERTPDEEASALRKLNQMMFEWPFSVLGYDAGDTTAEELSGFDPRWDQAVALALAQRLAPKELNGQPLSPESKAALSRSRIQLESYAGTLSMPTATMVSAISGEGNRRMLGSLPFIHES